MYLGDRFFYAPSRTVHELPEDLGLAYEDVRIKTTDGETLHGWFMPCLDDAPGTPAPTLLHVHGNAENITAHFQLVTWLLPACNVFCFDYRGYGRSTGTPTRAGTIRDTHAALDYLLSRPDVDAGQIVALGQSLGGAVATVVAAERNEIAALVIEGSFDRYRAIASYHFPPASLLTPLLISSQFDPADHIRRISPRPVFIVGSQRDRVCPPRFSRALYAAAHEPKTLWLGDETGHLETIASNERGIWLELKQFLAHALNGRNPRR